MRMGTVQQAVLECLKANGDEGMWLMNLTGAVAMKFGRATPDGPGHWLVTNAMIVSVRRAVATLTDAEVIYSDYRRSMRYATSGYRLAVWMDGQVMPPSEPIVSLKGSAIREAILSGLRSKGPEMEFAEVFNHVVVALKIRADCGNRFRVGLSQSIRRLESEGSIVATRAATPKGRPRCLSVKLAGD